jgi:hypothetical protein
LISAIQKNVFACSISAASKSSSSSVEVETSFCADKNNFCDSIANFVIDLLSYFFVGNNGSLVFNFRRDDAEFLRFDGSLFDSDDGDTGVMSNIGKDLVAEAAFLLSRTSPTLIFGG